MSVFTRSRKRTVLGGIALVGASALVLAGCAGGGRRRSTQRERRSRDRGLHPQDRHGPAADRQPGLPRPARGGRCGVRRGSRSTRRPPTPGSPSRSSTATRATPTTRHTRPRSRASSARTSPPSSAPHRRARRCSSSTRSSARASSSSRRPTPPTTSRPTTTTACTSAPRRPTCCRARCSATSIAEDGHQTLGMIVLNDSYGTGLAGYVTGGVRGRRRRGRRGADVQHR